jgi:type VI protein secretion system component VasF
LNKVALSAVVPVVSFIVIAVFAIALGYIFYQVHHHSSFGTNGVIVIGMALLILTPAIAFLLERRTEK